MTPKEIIDRLRDAESVAQMKLNDAHADLKVAEAVHCAVMRLRYDFENEIAKRQRDQLEVDAREEIERHPM